MNGVEGAQLLVATRVLGAILRFKWRILGTGADISTLGS